MLAIHFSGMPFIDYGVISFAKEYLDGRYSISQDGLAIDIDESHLIEAIEKSLLPRGKFVLSADGLRIMRHAKKLDDESGPGSDHLQQAINFLAAIYSNTKDKDRLHKEVVRVNGGIYPFMKDSLLFGKRVRLFASRRFAAFKDNGVEKKALNLIKAIDSERVPSNPDSKTCSRCGRAFRGDLKAAFSLISGGHSNSGKKLLTSSKHKPGVCIHCYSGDVLALLSTVPYWNEGIGKRSVTFTMYPVLSSFSQYEAVITAMNDTRVIKRKNWPGEVEDLSQCASGSTNLGLVYRSRNAFFLALSEHLTTAVERSFQQRNVSDVFALLSGESRIGLNKSFRGFVDEDTHELESTPFGEWIAVSYQNKSLSHYSVSDSQIRALRDMRKHYSGVCSEYRDICGKEDILHIIDNVLPLGSKNEGVAIRVRSGMDYFLEGDLRGLTMAMSEYTSVIHSYGRRSKVADFMGKSAWSFVYSTQRPETKEGELELKKRRVLFYKEIIKSIGVFLITKITKGESMGDSDKYVDFGAWLGNLCRRVDHGISVIKHIENSKTVEDIISALSQLAPQLSSRKYKDKKFRVYIKEFNENFAYITSLRDKDPETHGFFVGIIRVAASFNYAA